MNLKNFLYDFNLISTKSVNSLEEHCNVINNGRNLPINYQDCTNFCNLVSLFNKAYQNFLSSKELLKSLLTTFGKETRYGFFKNYEINTSSLAFEVIKPLPDIFDEDWAAIYLYDNDGEYQAIATNNLPFGHKQRKTIPLTNMSEETLKSIMSIIKNHTVLLEAFTTLQNKFLFGNGTTVIFTKIEGEIFDTLETFSLTFGNAYFNTTDFIEVKFKIGEQFQILYEDSKVTLQDKEIKKLSEKINIINELLNGLYVNNSLLPDLFKEKEKNKVLRKKDE